MPCPGMDGRLLELGSGRKRMYLVLKIVCMHAHTCAFINIYMYVCMLLERLQTIFISHLQETEILKKQVKPNLL